MVGSPRMTRTSHCQGQRGSGDGGYSWDDPGNYSYIYMGGAFLQLSLVSQSYVGYEKGTWDSLWHHWTTLTSSLHCLNEHAPWGGQTKLAFAKFTWHAKNKAIQTQNNIEKAAKTMHTQAIFDTQQLRHTTVLTHNSCYKSRHGSTSKYL